MGKKTLSEAAFEEASYFLLRSTRALERNEYNYYFKDAGGDRVLAELKNYQNPDGGFGHGLEPDLRLPYSSPIATVAAFQHMDQLEEEESCGELAESGIRYFEKTYREDKKRWFAVPKEVNEFPHASWWHFDEGKKGTVIDRSWANPTAEIIAYLLKYESFVQSINVQKLLKVAVEKLNSKQEFGSDHEVLCYLRLYKVLPSKWSEKIKDQLRSAVQQVVCTDPSKWGDYVSRPLHFVRDPGAPRFGISKQVIERNLDFLIRGLEEEGVINPSWKWSQYETEWKRAKKEWTGILTLQALIVLDRFGRVD